MPMVKPSISTHKYTTFFINTIKVQVGFWIIPTERGENRPKKHQLQPSLHTPSTLSNNKRPTRQGWSFLLHITSCYFALFTTLFNLAPNAA